MSATRTLVFLRAIRVRRNGTILMYATPAFLNVVRTRVGSPAGTHLRVGTFDFHAERTNIYVGTPDEFSPESKAEASTVAAHILAIFRSLLLFEAVFAEPGSYNSWIVFNRRSPTAKDLADLGRSKGIFIPFMALPYQQPKVDVMALLEKASVQASKASRVEKKILGPRPASKEKLQALAAAFAKHPQQPHAQR